MMTKEASMNRVALALLGLMLGLAPAAAQDWPAKTVRIIVPFGPGSTPDMVGRLIADHLQQKLGQPFALKSGTTMVHIPYPGSPQAMTAVLRNDVQMGCLPAIAVTPHVASGQVKILAISLGQRSALMPDYPTLREAGVDVEADAWNGLIPP